MGLCPAGPNQIEQGISIIASVGNDVAAFEPGEQLRFAAQVVVFMSGGEQSATAPKRTPVSSTRALILVLSPPHENGRWRDLGPLFSGGVLVGVMIRTHR